MENSITLGKEQQEMDSKIGVPTPESAPHKILTWQDIKNLANSLTEDQLLQPVKYWTENEGGTVGDANVLDEDYVTDGEAYAPKTQMAAEMVDEDEPVFPKGTVMLWII